MKSGYSILLGEHVEAITTGYEDCAHFQIVCFECREPVFKCFRKSEDSDKNLHYFSHYGAKLPEQKECDSRVKSYDSSEIEKHNSKSKNQRLSFFMKVLQSTLSTYPVYIDGGELAHRKMKKSEGILGLFELIKEAVHHPGNANIIDDLIKDVEIDFEKSEHTLNTTFAKHIQIRITKDMWITLLTIPEEINLLFLFRHAFLSEMSHWAPWIDRPYSHDKTLALTILSGFTDLYDCRKKRKVDKIIMSLASRTLPNSDGSTSSVLTRILGKVLDQMAEALIVMPYAELLTNKFGLANLSYPEGVIPNDVNVRKTLVKERAEQTEEYRIKHPINITKH